MRLPLPALALCVLAGGCRPAPWPGPAEAVLGGGVLRFLPWGDCARVPIIHGFQGGYHVWGGVRARYVTRSRLKLRFSVSDAEGRLVQYPGGARNPIEATVELDPILASSLVAMDGGTPIAGMCPDGGVPIEGGAPTTAVPGGTDGWSETYGVTVFMPFDAGDGGELLPIDDVDGRAIRIRLDLTDTDGRTASDERMIVPFYRR